MNLFIIEAYTQNGEPRYRVRRADVLGELGIVKQGFRTYQQAEEWIAKRQ